MRFQGIDKWVSVKFIVTFNADVEGAVGLGPRDTQYDVPIVDLAIVQCHLAALIDFSGNEFRCTRDATAVPAAVRQIDALLAQ